MPRVALTEEQRRDNERKDVCRIILRAMNARAGVLKMQKKAFAAKCGIGESTWRKWNSNNLQSASLWDVLGAAQQAGVKITVTVDPDPGVQNQKTI